MERLQGQVNEKHNEEEVTRTFGVRPFRNRQTKRQHRSLGRCHRREPPKLSPDLTHLPRSNLDLCHCRNSRYGSRLADDITSVNFTLPLTKGPARIVPTDRQHTHSRHLPSSRVGHDSPRVLPTNPRHAPSSPLGKILHTTCPTI